MFQNHDKMDFRQVFYGGNGVTDYGAMNAGEFEYAMPLSCTNDMFATHM